MGRRVAELILPRVEFERSAMRPICRPETMFVLVGGVQARLAVERGVVPLHQFHGIDSGRRRHANQGPRCLQRSAMVA